MTPFGRISTSKNRSCDFAPAICCDSRYVRPLISAVRLFDPTTVLETKMPACCGVSSGGGGAGGGVGASTFATCRLTAGANGSRRLMATCGFILGSLRIHFKIFCQFVGCAAVVALFAELFASVGVVTATGVADVVS